MVNIPMRTRQPLHTNDLGQLNRAGDGRVLQNLPSSVRSPQSGQSAPPQPVRSTPPQPVRSTPPQPVRSAPPRPVVNHPHPPATGKLAQKGQKISLSLLSPQLDLIDVGLGWDLGPDSQGYELDAEAFLLQSSGQALGDDWFVFYNQPASPDGAVRLLETRAGGGAWDDTVLQIRLSRLDPNVSRIALILTINEAKEHRRHFGGVANAYIRITDCAARRELVRFQLTDYYTNVCSMVVGEIYRYKDEWRFNPVGNGTGDDLAGLCVRYGINV